MSDFIRKHKWLAIIGGVILFGIVASAASGPSSNPPPQTSTYQTSPYQAQPTQPVPLSNDNSYTNSSGNTVHSPAYTSDNSIPVGASAQCGDGTYSFSQHRSGTCSHHGGVAN